MGVDIHLYVEKKVEEKWQLAEKLEKNEDFFDEDHEEPHPLLKPKEFENIRHSEFFAILGNKRLASMRTDEAYQVISSPRGLPNDVSIELKEWFEFWKENVIDPSWLTLKEIKEFDWDKKILRYAWVKDPEHQKLFKDGRQPFPHQAVQKGKNNEWICFATFAADYPYKVTWVSTYKEAVDGYFSKTSFLENILKRLESFGNDEELRVVFWFDE